MNKHALNALTNEDMGKAAGSNITPHQERLIVVVVLAAFVALAIGFSLGPILEGPDELEHYRFVRLLADTWQLPDRSAVHTEYHQPPLFYAIAALIKMNVADPDFNEIEARRNPGGIVAARLYVPNWQAQPNNDASAWLVHRQSEEFPYQSATARTVHLIRLLSVVLGAGTVITCYHILWLLWPNNPSRRLLGLGIIAFWPLFDYISGYITNDTAIIFFSTLTVYLTLRQIRDGPSVCKAILLGAVLGGALLSKANALLLAGPVGLAILFDWQRAWRYGLITLVAALIIGGWWYVRAAIVDSDPTGLFVQYQSYPDSYMPLGTISFMESLARMGHIYTRLWARFGWLHNVVVSPPIYIFFDTLTFTGMIGAIASGVRWIRGTRSQPVDRPQPRMAAILVVMGLVTFLAVYLFSTTNRLAASTGQRYLMLAISVWGSLLAYGLDAWIPHRWRIHVVLSSTLILATLAAISLFGYFLPAYRSLPPPAQIEYPRSIRYGGLVELIGVEQENIRAHPGEVVTITLYWRAIKKTDDDLWFRLDGEHSTIMARLSIPGSGNLPSYEWSPGQTWTERYVTVVPDNAALQVQSPLHLSVYDVTDQQTLTATAPDGRPIRPVIGWIVISQTN